MDHQFITIIHPTLESLNTSSLPPPPPPPTPHSVLSSPSFILFSFYPNHVITLSPPPKKKYPSELEFVNLLLSLGIDSQPGGPVRQPDLTCRPTRLHRLAELIPWNRFLGSLNVYKFGLCFIKLRLALCKPRFSRKGLFEKFCSKKPRHYWCIF